MIKGLSIFIAILAFLIPVSIYGLKINNDRQVQQLLTESKSFTVLGEYDKAVQKLVQAESKSNPDSTKKEIEKSIESNKRLIASTKNYELGKELYYDEMFQESIKVFKKVHHEDVAFQRAQEFINLAEEKLIEKESANRVVAGAKPTHMPAPIIKRVEQDTPIPTFSQPRIDATALCGAKKQQMTGSIAESAHKASTQAEANAKSDPLFYQVWMNITPNLEVMMKNWTVKTLGEYEGYCLTHNGDDSGWKPSSGPFDGINW